MFVCKSTERNPTVRPMWHYFPLCPVQFLSFNQASPLISPRFSSAKSAHFRLSQRSESTFAAQWKHFHRPAKALSQACERRNCTEKRLESPDFSGGKSLVEVWKMRICNAFEKRRLRKMSVSQSDYDICLLVFVVWFKKKYYFCTEFQYYSIKWLNRRKQLINIL